MKKQDKIEMAEKMRVANIARIDKCINLLRLTIAKLRDQKKLLK